MPLPGLVASQEGVNVAATPVRFISDLSQELLQGRGIWYWRVRVDAEYQPTADDLALVQVPTWVSGGRPGSPSPDWIIAGTPSNPSPWLDRLGPGTERTSLKKARARPWSDPSLHACAS